MKFYNCHHAAQGGKEGIFSFFISSMINGKASWTSESNGIWFFQRFWIFGSLDDIGTDIGGIFSNNINKCPFLLQSEELYYYNYSSDQWIQSVGDEINVDCSDGN